MEKIFEGAAGRLHISEPELFVDNEGRDRSGHMTHAMLEYAPGKIIAFNSNCSSQRWHGHSPFGWVEYRYSEDGGKSWDDYHTLQCTLDELHHGVWVMSAEKAVFCNGVITVFLLRNSQYSQSSCEPWGSCMYIQSFDLGKSWTAPVEFCPYEGRIYDAVVRDGVIYVLEFCNPHHQGKNPEDLYRLYTSHDNGATFQEESVVDIETIGHAYGALQFTADGTLLAFANNIQDGFLLAVSESRDNGKNWRRLPSIRLSEGVRNVQISNLGNGYVMHGRAKRDGLYGKGFVLYTSKDCLNWDDGILLEPEKEHCYYSNNLPVHLPGGEEKLLVQYSDLYGNMDGGTVNVMHLFLTLEK